MQRPTDAPMRLRLGTPTRSAVGARQLAESQPGERTLRWPVGKKEHAEHDRISASYRRPVRTTCPEPNHLCQTLGAFAAIATYRLTTLPPFGRAMRLNRWIGRSAPGEIDTGVGLCLPKLRHCTPLAMATGNAVRAARRRHGHA